MKYKLKQPLVSIGFKMDRLKSKSFKQENSFTIVLRTLIKQKEEIANKYKNENEQLHKLLIKQQNLLNKLNEDNMNLNKSINELKMHYSVCNNDKFDGNE